MLCECPNKGALIFIHKIKNMKKVLLGLIMLELQLNVKDYPSGMYFFEVNGESNSFIVD